MTERKEAVREEYDWQAHERIVDNLRRIGWDRLNAIEEADKIMARVYARPLSEGNREGRDE